MGARRALLCVLFLCACMPVFMVLGAWGTAQDLADSIKSRPPF